MSGHGQIMLSTRRYSHFLRAFCLWIAIASWAISSDIAGAGQTSKGQPVSEAGPLTYEFSVKLPDYPSQLAWSRDGKRVAVSQFNTGKIRFVDIEKRQLLDTVLETSGDPSMVWSPGDKFLALNDVGKVNGLRIFETATWKELGRKPRLESECILQTGPAFGFSADGKSLWTACAKQIKGPEPNWGKYNSFLKLNVPDFSVSEVFERFPPPIHGTHVSDADGFATETALGVDFSSVIKVATNRRDGLGSTHWHQFATLTTLNQDVHAGPTIELQANEFYETHVNRVLQWPERKAMIAFWMWPGKLLEKDVPVPNRHMLPRLETYDTISGRRITAFAPTNEHRIPLHDVVLSRRAGLVLGALSSMSPDEGAVAAWDPMTGRQMQLLPTGHQAAWLWLSHDETRLAVIVLNEIQIFRIN